MKKLFPLICILLLLCGCAPQEAPADIAATTLPVYQFTAALCEGTGLTVTRLVTESVSCLHDYSLNVRQVRAVESAKLIVISGAGLEEFMEDILEGRNVADASAGIPLLEGCHDHDEEAHEHHHHEQDSHIWLSPANAIMMAENICAALKAQYPRHSAAFDENLLALNGRLQALLDYGNERLGSLRCRDMVTFHDGFSYFAQCFDLQILAAVEEEAGSETSARQLTELIGTVRQHNLPAVFTESNGSDASARVIAAETGCGLYTLDMAMAGDDYFAAMKHNIDTIWEAFS